MDELEKVKREAFEFVQHATDRQIALVLIGRKYMMHNPDATPDEAMYHALAEMNETGGGSNEQ